jgi:tRNA nucleotidyltransferase (CCA-adding enzyme)
MKKNKIKFMKKNKIKFMEKNKFKFMEKNKFKVMEKYKIMVMEKDKMKVMEKNKIINFSIDNSINKINKDLKNNEISYSKNNILTPKDTATKKDKDSNPTCTSITQFNRKIIGILV